MEFLEDNNKYTDIFDDEQSIPIVELMNVYNIYYNKKNNTKGNMFSDANPFNKHSINNKMSQMYDDIKYYKTVSVDNGNCIETSKCKDDFKNNNNIQSLTIDNQGSNEIYYSTNVISLLLKLIEHNWVTLKWDINNG